MFEIAEGKVQLVHKNERIEKHGEEDVLACDLNFTWETNNGCLAMFQPDLRSGMYRRGDDRQGEIEPDPEYLTELRFPFMAPFKWTSGDVIGGLLTFHTGVSAKSHVKIEDVKVTKYRLECKEGGTVVVSFQVQCRPNEQQSGKLSKFLTDKHCIITVTPPGEIADPK